jgi:catechol 2,3-dioxygenase-like lactoylglutathione lyase family enzyme
MPHDRFSHLFIAPGDFDRSVAFYRDALGWRPVAAWGGNGEPRGTVLNGGGVEVVLAERHAAEDHSWSHGVNGRRPTLHLVVDDLDARFREVSAAAEVVVAPEATHWATRWFVVADPEGNLIAFEQPDGARLAP